MRVGPLFQAIPRFGGEGLTVEDKRRLLSQLELVTELMSDMEWRSLKEIEEWTGFPQGSISARLRDLRKPSFGGHIVERRKRRIEGGTWEYRLVVF